MLFFRFEEMPFTRIADFLPKWGINVTKETSSGTLHKEVPGLCIGKVRVHNAMDDVRSMAAAVLCLLSRDFKR